MLSILTLILIVPSTYAGSFGVNMEFHYCTKDENTIPGNETWPKGNYCILRQGLSCPSGFETGSIYWDDEDDDNGNTLDGVLPSGSYDRNTFIDYCCRSDGSDKIGIILPTSQSFYLLRFTSQCQQVQGMFVREESVETDDEDKNNENKVSGSHPLNDGGKNNRLYYCYYYT